MEPVTPAGRRPTARAEQDEWTRDGARIDDPDALAAVKEVLGTHGPVIVEWRFLRGGRAPDVLVFDDYDDYDEYDEYVAWLATIGEGDAVHVWDFWELCRDDNVVTSGKQPDPDGIVPRRGPY